MTFPDSWTDWLKILWRLNCTWFQTVSTVRKSFQGPWEWKKKKKGKQEKRKKKDATCSLAPSAFDITKEILIAPFCYFFVYEDRICGLDRATELLSSCFVLQANIIWPLLNSSPFTPHQCIFVNLVEKYWQDH